MSERIKGPDGGASRIDDADDVAVRDPDPQRSHIGSLLHEISLRRRIQFDRVLRPFGITRSQLLVLVRLSRAADRTVSQRELADAMRIGEVSLGEKVRLLETAGYVERRCDLRDRRQRVLFLTAAGREVVAASRKVVDAMNAAILAAIPPGDIAVTERTLTAMGRNLTLLDLSPLDE